MLPDCCLATHDLVGRSCISSNLLESRACRRRLGASQLGSALKAITSADWSGNVVLVEGKGLRLSEAQELACTRAQNLWHLKTTSAAKQPNLAEFLVGRSHANREGVRVDGATVLVNEAKALARSLATHHNFVKVEALVATDGGTAHALVRHGC